jgi:glycerate kinase
MASLDGGYTGSASAPAILGASKEQAKRISGSLKERALSAADGHKGQLADGLHKLAGNLEHEKVEGPAGQLIGYATSAAERAASALESNSAEELFAQSSAQVKARPGLFIAGCLGLGFLGARLLRK